MADASFLQSNFLGGEVSNYYQGRVDDPGYRTMMALCFNSFPVEQGTWTRRTGTRFLAPSYRGNQAVIRTFHFNEVNPYALELSAGLIRLFDGTDLVLETPRHTVLSISAASPASIQTDVAHGYLSGDEIEFFRVSSDTNFTPALLLARQFLIQVVDSTHFTITDSVTGAPFDGTTVTLGSTILGVARVEHFLTPYTEAGTPNGYDQVVVVQGDGFIALMHPNVPTYTLVNIDEPSSTAAGTFAFQKATFSDGPYLDPPADGSGLTPSGTSGSITLTSSYTVWDSGTTYNLGDVVAFNGLGYTSLANSNLGEQPDISSSFWQVTVNDQGAPQIGFLPTDVGRMVRLFSEPPAWATGTTYAAGALVKYAGTYWQSLIASNTANEPDINITDWQVSPSAPVWTWAVITHWTSVGVVTATLMGGNLLNTGNIATYRLGLYSNSTGYPSCGAYQEGRLWLAGAMPNRVDSSVSNRAFDFQPTAIDGTVADNNAISAPFQSTEANTVFWMYPEAAGVVFGTKGGEYLITASNLNDSLSPSSIQVRRVTKFGCDNVQPVRAPLSLIFVQKYGRKLIEYIADVYSGKYSGTNLAKKAQHLTSQGIMEIAYQQETTPIIWARMGDGSLTGLTYRRDSPFGTQSAEFAGAHSHTLGSGRIVESLQSGPSPGGDLDSIYLVTNNPATNVRWVEMLTGSFDEDSDITEAWYLDDSAPATGAEIINSNTQLKVAGFYYLAGQTVTAWAGGVDLGDFTVAADGTVTVTFGADQEGLFTEALLASITNNGIMYGEIVIVPNAAAAASAPDITGIQLLLSRESTLGVINNSFMSVNWDAGWASTFALETVSLVNGGMRRHSLTTGLEIDYATQGTWGANITDAVGLHVADTISTGAQDPVALDTVKDELYFMASISNYGVFRKSSAVPFRNIQPPVPGNESGSAGFPNTGGAAVLYADKTYVVSTSIATVSPQVVEVVDTTDMSVSFSGLLSFGVAGTYNSVVSGPSGGGIGSVFLTSGPTPGTLGAGTNTAFPIQVGKITASGGVITQAAIGSITPQNLNNVSWLQMGQVSQPIYDASDNSLIMWAKLANPAVWSAVPTYTTGQFVTGSDGHAYVSISTPGLHNVNPVGDGGVHWTDLGATSAVANLKWFFKVNGTTGAIVWKFQPTALPSASSGHSYTRLSRGSLYYALDDGNMTIINTTNGATSVYGSLAGVGSGGTVGQSYDDETGAFLISTTYTQTGGGPQAISPTPTSWGSQEWALFKGIGSTVPDFRFPFILGYTYNSDAQIVRPVAEQETGARNGPALAKTRRLHQYGALMTSTQGVSFGTAFDATSLYSAALAGPTGTALPLNTLFSGVFWDTLQDDYTYDGMLCWRVSRPYPANIQTVSGFLHTQDR